MNPIVTGLLRAASVLAIGCITPAVAQEVAPAHTAAVKRIIELFRIGGVYQMAEAVTRI
jgi:hypothetical protein